MGLLVLLESIFISLSQACRKRRDLKQSDSRGMRPRGPMLITGELVMAGDVRFQEAVMVAPSARVVINNRRNRETFSPYFKISGSGLIGGAPAWRCIPPMLT